MTGEWTNEDGTTGRWKHNNSRIIGNGEGFFYNEHCFPRTTADLRECGKQAIALADELDAKRWVDLDDLYSLDVDTGRVYYRESSGRMVQSGDDDDEENTRIFAAYRAGLERCP